jgi:hypothetical protein
MDQSAHSAHSLLSPEKNIESQDTELRKHDPSSLLLFQENFSADCSICYQYFADPVTLSCNHSFCRGCLVTSSMIAPDGSRCPLCRHSINTQAILSQAKNSILEEQVLRHVTAGDYADRLESDRSRVRQLTQQKAEDFESGFLPIFTMRNMMRIGDEISLRFFEPRYRLLARHAWEGNRLFLYSTFSPRPGMSAILVRISWVQFQPDGCANVLGRALATVVMGDVHVGQGSSLAFSLINMGTGQASGLAHAATTGNLTQVLPDPANQRVQATNSEASRRRSCLRCAIM